ncbi:hypothetical protein CEXT_282381 [Caerostris extrusa]|uniref:Uncharacterized protein n=1 Tax=Caerostris extrusa TaxID=172846 RepID=A0AAV4RC69_CAEEX|nr:hypothetical protein CEXT_282381 [Caerostris extrusa]
MFRRFNQEWFRSTSSDSSCREDYNLNINPPCCVDANIERTINDNVCCFAEILMKFISARDELSFAFCSLRVISGYPCKLHCTADEWGTVLFMDGLWFVL